MEAPLCTKCNNRTKLQRNPAYGDLQSYCPHCRITIYPLPKLTEAEDKRTDAEDQQGDIAQLIELEGLPLPHKRRKQ